MILIRFRMLQTGNKEYKRRIYKFTDQTTDGNIKYYSLSDTTKEGGKFFSPRIKIEKDNGFHKRSRFFEHWLYFRTDTNWKRCLKSGLAVTGYKFIFEGNIPEKINLNQKTEKGNVWENPKHLVLVQFSKDSKTVVIDVFKNFYPVPRQLIGLFVKEHQFYFSNN